MPVEKIVYGGESPQDRYAFECWRKQIERGKSLFQLRAMAAGLTPDIRRKWSPRTFTPVEINGEFFDEVVCNLAYHFHKHGQKYVTIEAMTRAASKMFAEQKSRARLDKGFLRFPDGSRFETTGRIVTFIGGSS